MFRFLAGRKSCEFSLITVKVNRNQCLKEGWVEGERRRERERQREGGRERDREREGERERGEFPADRYVSNQLC